jgi:hypothetical protein
LSTNQNNYFLITNRSFLASPEKPQETSRGIQRCPPNITAS